MSNKMIFKLKTITTAGLLACLLVGCGGGDSQDIAANTVAQANASADTPNPTVSQSISDSEFLPMYHMAPVVFTQSTAEQSTTGAQSVSGAASGAITSQSVGITNGPTSYSLSSKARALDTRRLTPEEIFKNGDVKVDGVSALAASGPELSAQDVTTAIYYKPDAIRAAYGLPALPTSWSGLSTADAVKYGAGQIIYIVDAYYDGNSFAALNTFSTKFGLPTCTNVDITSITSLVAPMDKCEFSNVSTNSTGNVLATKAAFNASWSVETALDVQWAHAIAPLAKIVLISTASAYGSDLMGGVSLANKFGPGVVSMSFGGSEANGQSSYYAANFKGSGMTYFASAGDDGTQVSWPAVSPNVVGVGGTSLTYNGSGTRVENVWSKSGGGISSYTAVPTYQANVKVNGAYITKRSVSDVALNADPMTGEYVYVPSSATAGSWYVVGGTSSSSPQWAALTAIANAQRKLLNKTTIGQDFSSILYSAASAGSTGLFLDITSGNNGTCTTCAATSGYDTPTGWGTPNFSKLMEVLGGAAGSALPPLPAATLPNGYQGLAYSYQFPTADSTGGALTYSTTGVLPTGITVSSTGLVQGTPSKVGLSQFGIAVKNKNGAIASQTETLNVVTIPVVPSLVGGNYVITKGSSWSKTIGVASSDATGTLTYRLTGAPAGMTISNTGVINWSSAVVGNYTIGVNVANNFGKTATAVLGLKVIPGTNPTITASSSYTGNDGKAFSATISAKSDNGAITSFAVTGNPAGMTVTNGAISWAAAKAGTYTMTVTAKDEFGYSTSQQIKIVIYANPVVTTNTATGYSGAPLSFTVGSTNPNSASTVKYAFVGAVPAGMTISATGVVSWSTPVAGVYLINVSATDSVNGVGVGKIVVTINNAPMVSSKTITANVGVALSYQLASSNPNNSNVIKYTATGLPAGATVTDAGLVSWATPVAGNYSFVVKTADKFGATASTAVVLNVNAAPFITSANASVTTGVPAVYTVKATAAAGSTIVKYSATGLPAGATINSTTGAITWTPSVGGIYNVVVAAYASTGAVSTKQVTFTVYAAPVVTTSADIYTGYVGQSLSFNVVATDSNNPVQKLTYAVAGLPAGATLSSTGSFVWARPAVKGTYAIKFTVSNTVGLVTAKNVSVVIK